MVKCIQQIIIRFYSRRIFMNRNILTLKRPASVNKEMWKTGLPLGNGITGALVFGAISEETIIVTRHDLWHARVNYKPLPDVSFALSEMREKIDNGDYHGACNLMYEALGDRGYPGFGEPAPFPLGAIQLNYQHDGLNFKKYRRGIDMEKGYAFVKWQDQFGEHIKRTFISRDDGILYYNIQNSQKCAFALGFGTYNNLDWYTENENNRRKENLKCESGENTIYYYANVDGQPFGAHIAVEINDDGYCRKNGATGLYSESEDFTVKLLRFAKVEDDVIVLEASPDFESALTKHSALHSAMYNKVSIELTDDNCAESELTNEELIDIAYEDTAPLMLYEKLWRFGRYLFVSAWSKNANPFTLYGLWAGTYDLPWNCHVCNENVEVIYWHVLGGDMVECLKNLIHYYYEKIDDCRTNARMLFGCRGIYIPTYTTPETMDGKNLTPPTPIVPVTLNWISGAGWLSLHFYQYYMYTHDAETLNSEIIPFMLEAAKFYEDYLTFDNEGKCKIYPSISPENTPLNLMNGAAANIGHPCPVTVNSTMDIAILKNFLTHLIELVSLPDCKVKLDDGSLETWQKILASIPDYMVNEDGAIKEWMHESLTDNYDHRHFSHLFPIFPGDEVSLASPKEQINAFFEAADRRLVKAQSGWSFPHLACIWARFGQGNRALESLATMTKSCLLDNFFTLHNDWRHMGASFVMDFMTPIQLDALMGTVSAIQDMLVQYNKTDLFILPARPDEFINIKVRGIRIPEGKVSVVYRDDVTEVSVSAECDCTLTLHCNSQKKVCAVNKGQTITVNF